MNAVNRINYKFILFKNDRKYLLQTNELPNKRGINSVLDPHIRFCKLQIFGSKGGNDKRIKMHGM